MLLNSNYHYVRDFLYMAALFAGIGLGLFACCFKPITLHSSAVKFRTIAFCLFSVSLSLISVALVLSKGLFVYNVSLIVISIIIMIIFAFATYFPIYVACPLVFLATMIIIFFSYQFFKYPSMDMRHLSYTSSTYQTGGNNHNLNIMRLSLNHQVEIEFAKGVTKKTPLVFNINTRTATLEYKITVLRMNPVFPLAGGKIYIVPLQVDLIDEDGFKLRVIKMSGTQRGLFNQLLPTLLSGVFAPKTFSDSEFFENSGKAFTMNVIFNGTTITQDSRTGL